MNKASNIKTFLIITFILMYLSSIITILLTRFGVFSFSTPLIQVLQFIAGGSPTIAAFFIIYYCYNPPKRERFFSRLFLFKVNFLWWVYAIILPFLILIFRHFIYYRSLHYFLLYNTRKIFVCQSKAPYLSNLLGSRSFQD